MEATVTTEGASQLKEQVRTRAWGRGIECSVRENARLSEPWRSWGAWLEPSEPCRRPGEPCRWNQSRADGCQSRDLSRVDGGQSRVGDGQSHVHDSLTPQSSVNENGESEEVSHGDDEHW